MQISKIKFKSFKKKSGSLIPLSLKKDFPIKVKRIFLIKGKKILQEVITLIKDVHNFSSLYLGGSK